MYDVVGLIAALLALPFLPVLALTRHGRGLAERLGRLPEAVKTLHRPVWIHAASVGEVLAAEPLLRELQARQPTVAILLTTTSVTGRETARTRLGVRAVMLLPVDLAGIIGRSLRRVQPRCLLIVETELWPGLIRAAARCGVPRLLVSGRISKRAAARYAWIRWLTRPMLGQMTACAMQSEDDAARIISLGAPADRVRVVGSLKFARDVNASATAATTGRASVSTLVDGRVLLVAASTHAGEEDLALDACATLWDEYPQLLLVIAPRRPERFDEVERLLERRVPYARRSRLGSAVGGATRVLLLDTLGELLDVLPVARAVFVGGTVAPVGGHNVLEPAVFAKPVAFGPHTANVAAAAQALLQAGAARRIDSSAELSAEWRRLLAQPEVAAAMGARGRTVIDAHAAVAARTLDVVRDCVPEGL
jgi:3-deoxy-D-manno-octulosonic-acid transferase